MTLKAAQPLTRETSLAKAGEGPHKLPRKQTFEDAVRRAAVESVQSDSPRYIHHRADGEFVVFAYRTAGTVAVAHRNGVLEC